MASMRRELLWAFGESIWAKSKVLGEVALDARERRRLLESISDDIKKCTDMAPPGVSVAAQAEANRRGVDLREMGWHDQPRFDVGRRTFHREHVTPVLQIREMCLKASSTHDIAAILESARVAWILKEEDRRLTKLGYRAVRPDPDAAYREAGITLAQLP